MTPLGRFKTYRKDKWLLVFSAEHWHQEFSAVILERIEMLAPAKHPQTLEVEVPGANERCFLKVFHSVSRSGSVKDFFRASKGLRALRAGQALREAGFNVAQPIAAGEE